MHSQFVISQADPRPLYLQIKEQIRHRVAVGDWLSGRELPSIRTLAVELSVSVITIKRAYLELEHEGVIVTRQGRGSFVSDTPNLGPNLQLQELDEHLRAASQLAQQLGISHEELERRLRSSSHKSKENGQ
jgi:GntR family transcriptional regulator